MQRGRGNFAVDGDDRHAGSSETADDAEPAAIVGASDNDSRDLRARRGGMHGGLFGSLAYAATGWEICRVMRRAVKRAPSRNRMTGPNVFAAARPTKYKSGTDDSKFGDRTGV